MDALAVPDFFVSLPERMPMRHIILMVTGLALVVAIIWLWYKPHFEPVVTSLVLLATLIGLIIEDKIHRRRQEHSGVIEVLYNKFSDTSDCMASILKPFQPVTDQDLKSKVQDFATKFTDFYSFFKSNRIHFDKKTANIINSIAFKLRDVHVDITTQPIDTEEIIYMMKPELLQERQEFWDSAREVFESDIQKKYDQTTSILSTFLK